MDDGRTTKASHTKSSPGAFGSGELKITCTYFTSSLLQNSKCIYNVCFLTYELSIPQGIEKKKHACGRAQTWDLRTTSENVQTN